MNYYCSVMDLRNAGQDSQRYSKFLGFLFINLKFCEAEA